MLSVPLASEYVHRLLGAHVIVQRDRALAWGDLVAATSQPLPAHLAAEPLPAHLERVTVAAVSPLDVGLVDDRSLG